MVWLIFAVIVIAGLALATLLFPVIIYIDSVKSRGEVYGNFSISWLMLLARYALKDKQIEIFVFNQRIVSRSHKEKPLKLVDIKKSKPPIKQISNIAGPLLRFFGDLVDVFRLKYLNIDITVGLDDPAHTGILTGILYAVRGSSYIGQNIRLTPDFTGQALNWDMKAKVSIIPIQVLPPIARFITNRQVMETGWQIIKR